MIEIKDKKNCCGCSACVQRCPKQCISLHEDREGFLYPRIDSTRCIDCGLCEKVCPILNQIGERIPVEIFAAKNINERIRCESSSGGIFTLLAEQTINAGGVVFGVKWNEYFEAVHSYTETKEGLAAFRGSKYVQSKVGETFKQAEMFLKQGRQVLFSGTPCQIAALKLYLRKRYDNLLAIDVVCHGVPSPKVWREYLTSLNHSEHPISYVNLRSKERGWRQYSYVIKANDCILYDNFAYKSPFLQGFSLNLTLRPSCYNCPAKAGRSNADITLADCWGVNKLKGIKDDNKGYSSVLQWKDAMRLSPSLAESITCKLDYDFLIENNPSLVKSSTEPLHRNFFWDLYQKEGINAVASTVAKLKSNYLYRVYNKIRTLLNL